MAVLKVERTLYSARKQQRTRRALIQMSAIGTAGSRIQRQNSTGEVLDLTFHPATTLLPTTARRAATPKRTMPQVGRSNERAPPKQLGEVIEISSDEEDDVPPPPRPSELELRKQLEQAEKAIADRDSEMERVKKELAELKAAGGSGNGQVVLSFSQVEDSINCDICSSRMWQPHILPDCGHTFCQSCLQDWFGTTLAQYMQEHPHYNPTNQRRNNPYPNGWGAPWRVNNDPGPLYTCPSCRKPVTNKPVEDFTLKALVRTLASATGESSPRKPPPPQPSGSRRKTRATNAKTNDIWDGFFPVAAPAAPLRDHMYNMW